VRPRAYLERSGLPNCCARNLTDLKQRASLVKICWQQTELV
jgi:hypothetical protein